MNKDELFTQAKEGIGIFTNYQDKQLKPFFNDVYDYILGAGVSEQQLLSESSVGVVARGLLDLWSYGAGDGRLSEYFISRVAQIRLPKNPERSVGNVI